MRNIKKIFWFLAGIIAALLFAGMAYEEFYIWQAHGYRADYNVRQACIEVFPRDLELEEKCNALD